MIAPSISQELVEPAWQIVILTDPLGTGNIWKNQFFAIKTGQQTPLRPEGAAKLFRFFFFHYPDPQSAWQSGTCHQANLFLIVFYYDYVGSSALTSCVWKTIPYWRVNWLRARNVEIVLRKFHFQYFFRPNLLLTLFLPVENGSNDFLPQKLRSRNLIDKHQVWSIPVVQKALKWTKMA